MKASDRLNIQVTNFGPIVEADVDLRPFTLFVGPSNTGKSYLAIMIYALHRRFSGSSGRFPPLRGGPLRWYPRHQWRDELKDESLLSDDVTNYFLHWAQQVFSGTQKAERVKGLDPLPDKVVALIRAQLESIDVPDEYAKLEITRCFGLESSAELVRRPRSTGAKIVLRRYVGAEKEGENPFVHQFNISKRGAVRLSVSIPAEKPLGLEDKRIEPWVRRMIFYENDDTLEDTKISAVRLINLLAEAVIPQIIGPIGSPAYYLPADRTGVMHAHRVVVSALVERATSAGIHPESPVPLLSGVLADFLEGLIALGDLPGLKRRRREDLAAKLESTILGGRVHHEESAELESYPSFSYLPTGWKKSLPLASASSMVSELAPVVLYLRHVVRPGDVLIIEEPESHLHPAMQVEFTRLLAAAVRKGIRIIMTTHSEWVLEELANLVRISKVKKADRKRIAGGDTPLAEHEVGAWLFKPKKRPKGSFVEEIKLDRESGTFPSGYDEVAAALHNRWAEISSYSDKPGSR